MSQGKFFFIQSDMNEMCLCVQDGAVEAGTPVCTTEMSGESHQLWYVDHVRAVIRNKIDDNFVLEIQGRYIYQRPYIRGFPDHATFREKGAKLACVDKLGVLLSLTLCNKANFDPLKRVKYDGLQKM